MNAVVSIKELTKVLPGLGRVAVKRPVLPVLGMVRVDVQDVAVRMTAMDLDFVLTVELHAHVTGPSGNSFLVEMEELRRVCKTMANAQVDLRTLRSEVDVDQFPPDPELQNPTPLFLQEKDLRRLWQAMECVGDEASRSVLCGVCFDPADGGRLIGSNGRHLTMLECAEAKGLDGQFILPGCDVLKWAEIRKSKAATLQAGKFGKEYDAIPAFSLSGDGWSVVGKGIEGTYPNYHQVIPEEKEFKARVELGKGAEVIAEKLELLGKWKESPAAVGLRVVDRRLEFLWREKADSGFEAMHIPTAKIDGPDVTVYVDRKYLIKPLRYGLTRLALWDECSPMKFSGESGLLVVMPMQGVYAPPPVKKLKTRPRTRISN